MLSEFGLHTLSYFFNEKLYKNYMTDLGLTIILHGDEKTLTNVYVENIIGQKVFSNCKIKYSTLTNTIIDTSNYNTIHESKQIIFLYNGNLYNSASGPIGPTPAPAPPTPPPTPAPAPATPTPPPTPAPAPATPTPPPTPAPATPTPPPTPATPTPAPAPPSKDSCSALKLSPLPCGYNCGCESMVGESGDCSGWYDQYSGTDDGLQANQRYICQDGSYVGTASPGPCSSSPEHTCIVDSDV